MFFFFYEQKAPPSLSRRRWIYHDGRSRERRRESDPRGARAGFAALTKRPTSCVLVSPKPGVPFEHQDLLDKAIAKIASEKA